MSFAFYERLEQNLIDRFVKKTDDLRKIEKIFVENDLGIRIGRRMYYPRFKKQRSQAGEIEYIFNVPLGITFNRCLELREEISNSLNKRVEMNCHSLLHIHVFEQRL